MSGWLFCEVGSKTFSLKKCMLKSQCQLALQIQIWEYNNNYVSELKICLLESQARQCCKSMTTSILAGEKKAYSYSAAIEKISLLSLVINCAYK